jgi:hypothetical protein
MDIPAGAGDKPEIQAVLNWEKTTFDTTHIEAGNVVLAMWGMNPLFSEVLAHQYDVEPSANPNVNCWSKLLHLVTPLVASTEFGLGLACCTWPVTEEMLLAVGLPGMHPQQLSKEIALNTMILCEQSGLAI